MPPAPEALRPTPCSWRWPAARARRSGSSGRWNWSDRSTSRQVATVAPGADVLVGEAGGAWSTRRTSQINHLSVRCKYEVALPTAVNNSGVQPQLLVAVRNVRASRQWRTTGLLDVDTRPGHLLCDLVGAEKSMRTAHATIRHSCMSTPGDRFFVADRGPRQRASSSRDAEGTDHVLTDGMARGARAVPCA